MAIASYADFYPTMRMRVAPCPDELILQALQYAVRQFCIDSESYVWESDPYDVTADQFVFTLDQVATGVYDVIRVKGVSIKTDTSSSTTHSKGMPVDERAYKFLKPNILQFFSPPLDEATTDCMYVELVLAPFEDYTTMDWNFVNRWIEPIRAKALAYLYSIPQRIWSNPQLAAYFEGQYRYWLGSARRENETRGTSHQLRMEGGDSV